MFGNNIRKGVLLKYRSFIKFQEPPILQGSIHGTELPELGFGHNFPLECTSDLKQAFHNYVLTALFRHTPFARLFQVASTLQLKVMAKT